MKKLVLVLLSDASFQAMYSQTKIIGGFKNRAGSITGTKATTDSAMGVGTSAPDGKTEIFYCPIPNQDHNGLVVTKQDCHVGTVSYNPLMGRFNDVIVNTESGTEPSYYPSPVSPVHYYTSNTPLGFNIGSINNSLNPLFWARYQSLNSTFGPGSDDSRFIVFPDGRTGINITTPRCALDVRSFGANKPAAIFGVNAQRAPFIVAGNPQQQRYTKHVEIIPHLSDYGYNRISKSGDLGIFFTDGLGNLGINQNGSLVIAPWSDTSADGRNAGGIRIDQNGDVELRETLKTTEVNTVAKWWPDFVFAPNYKLMSLDSVAIFIQNNKKLPNMPSESEIVQNGQNVSELQKLQQQKIEELTLYLIELKKLITDQQTTIQQLTDKVNVLGQK